MTNLMPGAVIGGDRAAANDNQSLGLPPVSVLKELLKPLADDVGRCFPDDEAGPVDAGFVPEPG